MANIGVPSPPVPASLNRMVTQVRHASDQSGSSLNADM